MPEGYLTMSANERERWHLIRRTIERRLSQREMAERPGIGVRQVKRPVRAAHNRLPDGTRLRIERLLRETYPDFGPTLAAEKLAERNGIVVSRETVRSIQTRLQPHRSKKRGERGVFRSGTAVPDLANWFRLTVARTTGSKGAARAAR